MKIIASDRTSHNAADLPSSSSWNESGQKSKRCKSVDVFIFMMGTIENERYSDRSHKQIKSSDTMLNTRESWQADFYKDDYDTDEDN